METIRETNEHSLIAHYIYPFIDFWNLVEYHILIWIACVFFSGTLFITQPILIVCESSKMTGLYIEKYFVRLYQAGIVMATFQAFLDAQFDMAFLEAMCIILEPTPTLTSPIITDPAVEPEMPVDGATAMANGDTTSLPRKQRRIKARKARNRKKTWLSSSVPSSLQRCTAAGSRLF